MYACYDECPLRSDKRERTGLIVNEYMGIDSDMPVRGLNYTILQSFDSCCSFSI